MVGADVVLPLAWVLVASGGGSAVTFPVDLRVGFDEFPGAALGATEGLRPRAGLIVVIGVVDVDGADFFVAFDCLCNTNISKLHIKLHQNIDRSLTLFPALRRSCHRW